MNPYNGFTPAQRNKAQKWLNKMWDSGQLARPCRCASCGQEDGLIQAHAEDYSEPFAPGKTDQYHLCFACHMFVHCRFGKGRHAFEVYAATVAAGNKLRTHIGHWAVFQQRCLNGAPVWPDNKEVPNDAFIPSPEATHLLMRLFVKRETF